MTRRPSPLLSAGLLVLGMTLLGLSSLSSLDSVRAAEHTVSVTDGGFSPPSITIAPGDTVTWTNNSSSIQTIHSLLPGSDPNFFAKPFLYQNQSWSHTFSNAGAFNYQSNTTDITGTVIVSGSGGGGGPTATSTATPSGGGGGGGGGADNVTITSGGFSPQSITVPSGSTVTWTNNSGVTQTVHSLLPGSDPNFFAKPFLYNGESWSHTFPNPGTYQYHSNTTDFTGTVVVTGGSGGGATATPAATKTPTPTLPPGTTPTNTPVPPPGTTSTPAGPNATATKAPTQTPTRTPTAVPTPATNKVSITESAYQPQTITVTVGTTVTWTNNASRPRSATSPKSGPGSFASGLILPGKTFSHTFTVEGTFPYKSAISGSTGTVVVVPVGGGGAGPGSGGSLPFSPMGPGWNLVTYGGATGAPSQALAQLGDNYTAVYYWDGHKWHRYFRPGVAPAFLNNITTVAPGQPLWILATAAIP
jgi:plastocyanin